MRVKQSTIFWWSFNAISLSLLTIVILGMLIGELHITVINYHTDHTVERTLSGCFFPFSSRSVKTKVADVVASITTDTTPLGKRFGVVGPYRMSKATFSPLIPNPFIVYRGDWSIDGYPFYLWRYNYDTSDRSDIERALAAGVISESDIIDVLTERVRNWSTKDMQIGYHIANWKKTSATTPLSATTAR